MEVGRYDENSVSAWQASFHSVLVFRSVERISDVTVSDHVREKFNPTDGVDPSAMTRSTTSPTEQEPTPEMAVVGYLLAAGSLLLLLPVVPFLAIAWAFDRLRGRDGRTTDDDR